jgi:hypothetical protein
MTAINNYHRRQTAFTRIEKKIHFGAEDDSRRQEENNAEFPQALSLFLDRF